MPLWRTGGVPCGTEVMSPPYARSTWSSTSLWFSLQIDHHRAIANRCRAQASSMPEGPAIGRVEAKRRALVCSACTQNNEVRHVVVKSSWGPDGGNPPSTRQGRSQHRTTREGASGRSPTMQYRTERKRSAVRGVRTWGELANGSEAHIRRTGGRIGDGVGTKFCVLTRGDLSASAWSAVVIEEPTTR